jgi:hypothetical protein
MYADAKQVWQEAQDKKDALKAWKNSQSELREKLRESRALLREFTREFTRLKKELAGSDNVGEEDVSGVTDSSGDSSDDTVELVDPTSSDDSTSGDTTSGE